MYTTGNIHGSIDSINRFIRSVLAERITPSGGPLTVSMQCDARRGFDGILNLVDRKGSNQYRCSEFFSVKCSFVVVNKKGDTLHRYTECYLLANGKLNGLLSCWSDGQGDHLVESDCCVDLVPRMCSTSLDLLLVQIDEQRLKFYDMFMECVSEANVQRDVAEDIVMS